MRFNHCLMPFEDALNFHFGSRTVHVNIRLVVPEPGLCMFYLRSDLVSLACLARIALPSPLRRLPRLGAGRFPVLVASAVASEKFIKHLRGRKRLERLQEGCQ